MDVDNREISSEFEDAVLAKLWLIEMMKISGVNQSEEIVISKMKSILYSLDMVQMAAQDVCEQAP